jgi:hypothetical protein
MQAEGFASGVAEIGTFGPWRQRRVEFRSAGMPSWRVAVVAYYVESIGLTCVAVDALTGPQVALDGVRLIGRRPSELDGELITYLVKLGKEIEYSPWATVGSSELGMLPRPQRAGDVLLSRGLFGRPNAWANTMFDCIPAAEARMY